MKVYRLQEGKASDGKTVLPIGHATEHHAIDAREIVKEQPQLFTLRDPKAPKEEAEVVEQTPEAAASIAERKKQEDASRKEIADAAKLREAAIADAKRKANKLRDEFDEAKRRVAAAPKAGKSAAEAAAADAEKAVDDADSEVARLESGGDPLPPRKVAIV